MNDKKNKAKLVLAKSKVKDLEGFEELIQDYYTDVEVKSPKKAQDHRLDDFDLLNFLENEHQRLEKINVAFTSKIPNYINHPQAEALCLIQEKKIDMCESEIIDILIEEESLLNANISRLMRSLN